MVNEQPSIERQAALKLHADCMAKLDKIRARLTADALSDTLLGPIDGPTTWGEVSWWIDVYSDLEQLAEKVG